MLQYELDEAITSLTKSRTLKSKHRAEQVNRILRWARAHWETFEPTLYTWLTKEKNNAPKNS